MTSITQPIEARIPLARPDIGDRELELVTQVLRSDVLALGPFAPRFEAAIAALAGRREGIACSSGTAGLHMGVRALGIGEGDEVITTPFSFVASANCLLYERAIPRFVDIEEDSLGLDPDLVEAAAGPRTRAILPVQVFGRPCRIEALDGIARRRGWRVDRGRVRGPGLVRRRPAAGELRRRGGVRVLPQQADHHGRGRHGRHGRPGAGRRDAQPAQPGSRHGRDVAPPRAPRLQLPPRRAVRGPRRGADGAAGRARAPGGPASRRPTRRRSVARTGCACRQAGPRRGGRLVRVRRPAGAGHRPRRDHGRAWRPRGSRPGRTSRRCISSRTSGRPSGSSPGTSR